MINLFSPSNKLYFLCITFACFSGMLQAYDQPDTLNYGYTNILAGGPVRPASGWYFHQYAAYYYTDDFVGVKKGTASPNFNTLWGISELLYQTKKNYFLNARIGFDLQLYYVLYSQIQKNNLGLTDSGAGFSDPYMGLYLQWDPIMRNDRALFVHRFEFAASFPWGKYKKNYFFNPGNGFYYINPNWAATLFFNARFATSWNLGYVWNAKNKHTGIQAGQAMLLNYSIEAELVKDFWFAATGYYLQQFTDSKINDKKVPGRRESVFAIGPGMCYDPTGNLSAFGYLYFERGARNHTNGISAIATVIVNF